MFLVAADFGEVYRHRLAAVVVYQHKVAAAQSDDTVVAFAVLTGDYTLVALRFSEREGEHKPFQVSHLFVARVVHGFPPWLFGSERGEHSWTHELHHGVMAVGMSETSGEYRPVGIAAHVVVLPARSGEIVQSLWNVLIRRFTVDYRFQWLLLKAHVHIAPVVLLGIVLYGVVAVTIALSVAAVTALKHVEVHPLAVVKPSCRRGSASWVESHDMAVVVFLYGTGQSVPHFRRLVAENVSAYHPDDVRLVLVSLTQELAVGSSLLHVHLADHRPPDAVHGDIYSVVGSAVYDVVQVFPVSVDTRL